MSTPSALVADRYRLVRMLGAGGMGIVWQAWDTRLRRPVALKMLRTQPELTDAEREAATERAMREAQITAGLHHPHAVTVFDVVEHEGQPCIVMQLIESTPLSELLRVHGPFTPEATARIGAQVASALAAAHELKIVHRDVKPGNILIRGDGSAMISDFGISRALGDATITATGIIHGTPAYLAPEVARGLPTSFASDVFSLGSTLYAVVEGKPPFGTDDNAIALLHRVARGGYPAPGNAGPLAPMLRKMLASHPKRRPTMAWVADALQSMADAEADPAAAAALVALGFEPDTVAMAVAPGARGTLPEMASEPAAGQPTDAADLQVDRPTVIPPTIPTEQAADGAPEQEAAVIESSTTRPLVGKTIPIDRPTRDGAPTAETEPLSGPARPGAVELPWVTQEPPGDARAEPHRRRLVIAAAMLLVLVMVGVGAVLLLSSSQPGSPVRAVPTTAQTSVSTHAPTTPKPEVAGPAPNATSPSAQPEPTATSVTPEQRVVAAISNYYAMMP